MLDWSQTLKIVLNSHLLGYRISAISKSFTRQMGRNESLEDKVEQAYWKVYCELHTKPKGINILFSKRFLDIFLNVKGPSQKSTTIYNPTALKATFSAYYTNIHVIPRYRYRF